MLDTQSIPNFDILGVKISAINPTETLDQIDWMIKNKQKGYICVCPVSTIMECQKNETLRHIVNQAFVVTPDGMPTVWIGKKKGFPNIRRVYGPDLMKDVCQLSQEKGYKNYFFGATKNVLQKLDETLKIDFQNLNICGSYAPPFVDRIDIEDQEVINSINEQQPDIIWVGLGSPKQDLWMAKNRDQLNASVLIGVGAAFDFVSNTKKQAPHWMQKSGLEWLFRLCCEPKRLWRRYLIGNTKFIYFYLKQSLFKSEQV